MISWTVKKTQSKLFIWFLNHRNIWMCCYWFLLQVLWSHTLTHKHLAHMPVLGLPNPSRFLSLPHPALVRILKWLSSFLFLSPDEQTPYWNTSVAAKYRSVTHSWSARLCGVEGLCHSLRAGGGWHAGRVAGLLFGSLLSLLGWRSWEITISAL